MLDYLKFRRRHTAQTTFSSTSLGFRVAPDAKASTHAGGVVLMSVSRGAVFSANRVGALIWNAAAERWNLDRVVESIRCEFDIPAESAREDAAEFLAQLAAAGLLIREAN